RCKAVSRFHISREWLHRLSTFAEPGPITNFDFLCPHGLISPRRAKDLNSYYAEVPSAAWDYLHQEFGGGPVCSSLQYCVTCQNEFLRLQTKRNAELAAFKQLQKMERSPSVRWHHPPNLITRSWFSRWERFVLNHDEEPPPAIDNSSLLTRPAKEGGVVRLKQSGNYMTFTRDMWLFFVNVYGGGPEVFLVHDHQPTADEVAKWDEERQRDLLNATEDDLQLNVTQLTLDNGDSDHEDFGDTHS
uniref:DUSP domain-containing protein n=1 Tax=Plectus sambesii TaxID=2011161 RepID=A0A914UJT3_9BILA